MTKRISIALIVVLVSACSEPAAPSDDQNAATAIANERRGETIILFTEDEALKREHLLASARRDGQAEVAVARTVSYLQKLPRLGSGKIDYQTLRQIAQERHS